MVDSSWLYGHCSPPWDFHRAPSCSATVQELSLARFPQVPDGSPRRSVCLRTSACSEIERGFGPSLLSHSFSPVASISMSWPYSQGTEFAEPVGRQHVRVVEDSPIKQQPRLVSMPQPRP